ncbi:MAG: transcriptional regulator with XRE-family HTH domain [Rickettsiales bacterium]|jgi:transcriptional regulator with XRE-family HTH domain
MQEYLVKIGSAIKKIRKEQGVTIENIAFDTGLSSSTISYLENAVLKDVRMSTLFKIIDYLKIDFYLLLSLALEDKNLNKNKRELIHKILSIKDEEINKLDSFREVLGTLDKTN